MNEKRITLDEFRSLMCADKRKMLLYDSAVQPLYSVLDPLCLRLICSVSDVFPESRSILLDTDHGEIYIRLAAYIVVAKDAVGHILYRIYCRNGFSDRDITELVFSEC